MAPATMIQTPLRSGRTGDLGGNLARIDRELRRIRFPVAFDEDGAREGSPMALLPALHYAMLGFSRHVTRSLSDEGHDLQAKSDSRFVENAWKALRESFHYNPTLTPTQFLSPGFAERKLLLLADAIELCKRRHNEHARAARAADVKAVVAKEGGPRVARETRVKDTADGGRAEERKQRTPGRPIQIRRDPPANAATLARGVANLRVSTEDNEPRTAENSDDDDDDDDDGNFEFRPSPSPNRSRPPLADLAASGDAPPWFARSAALRSQTSSIAIDPTHDERDSFTVRESRESARADERLEGPTEESASDRRGDTANLSPGGEHVEPAMRLGSVRRSGGFPDENDPRTTAPTTTTPAVDHAPAIETLRVELIALVSRVADAEARAADAERRAAVAVDVANNAERRASMAEDAAADARKECDAIAQRVAAANAGLAEHGARAFLLEGRVRILEESARRRHDDVDDVADDGGDGAKRPASEGAPATNDDDEAPAIAPAAAPTPPRSPRASAGGAIAAVEWPNVRDSPWAYRSPPNARSSVRDSDQSYFAPPTVAGVAAGVFADDDAASDWDATVNSSAEWGEASPIRSAVKGSRAGGVGAGRDARDAKPPGIDAGAFVDYYSKLLSTTEETLRKTKGAE